MMSLRSTLRSGATVIAPGVHDALGARLTESVGFSAASISGFGVSASKLGSPDIGLLTLTEMVTAAREIASCVDIPVMCDGDTGYGDSANVRRAVAEFEAAGVSSLMLEDQVAPKRCALQDGVKVVPVNEYVRKLHAALAARDSEEFLIVARTDARAQHGLDEAISRGRIYADTGADVIFVEGIQTLDEAAQIRDEIPNVPLLYNVQEDSEYPYLLPNEAERLGYQIVMYPIALTRLYTHAAERYLQTLLRGENTNGFVEIMSSVEHLEGLVQLETWRSLEAESLGAADQLLLSRPSL